MVVDNLMTRKAVLMIKRLGYLIVAGLSVSAVGIAHSESMWPEGQMPKIPIYRPLTPDAPKVRMEGHVRATEDAVLTLTVLAPEEVGLTTKEQPSLYWVQSKSTNTHVTLTITT